MKKLMMMVAACAAMVMGATAATPSLNGAYVEDEMLCLTSSQALTGSEHYCVMFGSLDSNGAFGGVTPLYFAEGAHSAAYSPYGDHGYQSLTEVMEACEWAEIKVAEFGDTELDWMTHYVKDEIGNLYKTEDGVWNWRGANGTSGVIGTSAPVDDDEPTVEPEDEDEQKQTKCPVLSFFRKLFGKR